MRRERKPLVNGWIVLTIAILILVAIMLASCQMPLRTSVNVSCGNPFTEEGV